MAQYNGGELKKEAFSGVRKKKKWIKWIVIAVIVALIAAWMMFFSEQSQSVAYTEVPVVTGDLTTYYNFDGLVHARRVQTMTAEMTDTVRTVYVQQNQQVKKGDRIYRLESGSAVEADIDGEVTGLYIEEGDLVTAGAKVAEIIDMDRLEVQLNVDEYDVTAVTLGSELEIAVLATDQTYMGTVTAIDKNGVASGDLSYYTVTAQLAGGEGAYPGMQVSAKVLRDQALGATLLKVDAVQFDEYNEPYVLMRTEDGKDVIQAGITVGMSDGVYCEILDGLRAGETVLKPSGLSMAQIMEQMRQQSGSMRR